MKITRLLANNIRLAIAKTQFATIENQEDSLALMDAMDALAENASDIQRFKEKIILVYGGKATQDGRIESPAIPERKNDNDEKYEERLDKHYATLAKMESRINDYMSGEIDMPQVSISEDTYKALLKSGNPTWIRAKKYLNIP